MDTPSLRVIQLAADSFELPCSVCGKIAVKIQPTGSEEKILKGVICKGIARSFSLDQAHLQDIFRWLAAGDIAAFHAYLEPIIEGGVDAYCPLCDRVYCGVHYNTRQEFDEWFYDCCRGVCPQGHERLLDD